MEALECWGEAASGAWRNRLYQGDNLAVMQALLPELAGQVDLVYIDPPFASGGEYTGVMPVGGGAGDKRCKKEEALPYAAYSDAWRAGVGDFLSMLRARLLLIYELLAPHGALFVHLDSTASHLVRVLLDEIFGPASFCNHIVWSYRRWPSVSSAFQRMHDDILFYRKQPRHPEVRWQPAFEEISTSYRQRFKGKTQVLDPVSRTRKIPLDAPSPGLPLRDVWELPILAGASRERVGYPTQKPEALLRRIIGCASRPGDLVADFFCGSGTALVVAEALARRWLGCDMGPRAVQVTRRRLLELGEPARAPGELLQIGSAPPSSEALPQLVAEVRGAGERAVAVALQRFTPAPGDVAGAPPRLQQAAHGWLDYLDSWAVDWDYRGGPFVNRFCALRSPPQRALPAESAVHTYPTAGRYQILVHAVDVFGRTARQLLNFTTD